MLLRPHLGERVRDLAHEGGVERREGRDLVRLDEDARGEVFVADIALEELKVLARNREPLEPREVSTLEADVM